MKKGFLICFITILTVFYGFPQNNKGKRDVIVLLELKRQIDPIAKRATNKSFELAEKKGASAIIIDMNTPGGTLNDADSIHEKIINSKIPVYVLINPNAASAGALIALSCNKIYMTKAGRIGAATVVTGNAQELPDKYQSYMRAMMRASAELRGRNPEIAEKMVGIPVKEGDSFATKVLTLTRSEAEKLGYCDGRAETLDEVLTQEGFTNYKIEEVHYTIIDKIINFLINPVIQGFLILIIIAGIYYELQTPGVGFPLAAAITAAVLYFAPLYLEQLAASWEILVFILGVGLMILEIFVLPGFGIAGISGIVLMLTGLILSMVDNVYFDFKFTAADEVVRALLVVMSSFIISVIVIFATGGQMIRSKPFQRLVLQSALEKPDFRESESKEERASLSGMKGITITPMRPSGKIQIGENVYNALTEGEYLKKNTSVVVVNDFGNKIIVRECSEA
ncbi:MAG TPA: NfeD family protein [Bacteroidia bacterium]|nr:NfeD family protein [Bacteroidia bacterium]HRS58329.1 NfeD family protein [Bacteroidia bacterium]HRU69024.1 NfeD family protein [Bacteroidia bacterium]